MAAQVFIFGLGYIGEAWAEMMAAQGFAIAGTTRTPSKLSHRIDEGWEICAYNSQSDQPENPSLSAQDKNIIINQIAKADILLSTIALKGGRDPVMADFEEHLLSFKGWAGYLSVTSVYASQSEGWVDEHTTPKPQSDRGKARLAAEKKWLQLPSAEIFRLGGIYGPHRNPFEQLRKGQAQIIEKPGQLFNRMHQQDMCKVIAAALHQPRSHRIINLVDGAPAAQGDMIRFSASLLGIKPPKPIPFEQAILSEMGKSFYQTSRRICSTIIGPELGLALDFPDYKSGLTACFEAENISLKDGAKKR